MLRRVTVGVIAGAILAFGSAGPAAGSTTPEATGSACWSHEYRKGLLRHTVWVTNRCSTAVAVKVVTFSPRPACLTVPAGEKRGWRLGRGYMYLGVQEVTSCS